MSQEQASFKKMGNSEQRRPGPRGILLCGFNGEEQRSVESLTAMMVEKLSIDGLPLSTPIEGDLCTAVERVFEQYSKEKDTSEASSATSEASDAKLPRAIILSGMSEREIHAFMGGYRSLGLEKPLWASLTETSRNWPLEKLLLELSAERKAIAKESKKGEE
mgnify:FL=1